MQEVGRGGGAKKTNLFCWWCGQKSLHAPSVGRSPWQGYPDSEKSSDGRGSGCGTFDRGDKQYSKPYNGGLLTKYFHMKSLIQNDVLEFPVKWMFYIGYTSLTKQDIQ
jgi:hypothetical protein